MGKGVTCAKQPPKQPWSRLRRPRRALKTLQRAEPEHQTRRPRCSTYTHSAPGRMALRTATARPIHSSHTLLRGNPCLVRAECPSIPNITSLFKSEIARVARKEIKAQTLALKSASSKFRSDIAALKCQTAGPGLGWLMQRLLERVQHIPAAIILQFVGATSVWLLAEHIGPSGVLTTVCFAMTLGRTAPARTPARIRIPTDAVWGTVVFALNIFAFISIGLQIRPILVELAPPHGSATCWCPSPCWPP
jgi:monovalent cation/hydrogen antiporter